MSIRTKYKPVKGWLCPLVPSIYLLYSLFKFKFNFDEMGIN